MIHSAAYCYEKSLREASCENQPMLGSLNFQGWGKSFLVIIPDFIRYCSNLCKEQMTSDKIAASIDPRVFPERKDISIGYSPLLAEDDH